MKKFLIISLILLSSSLLYAGENEDFKYVDNLYKEQDFKNALIESEKFLEKYPNSEHQKSMKDKVGKLYFLNKNYKKAEEIFKNLYMLEDRRSEKDEYATYLARINALTGKNDTAMFYLNEIESKKTYQKALSSVAQDFLSKENNEGAKIVLYEIIENKYDNYKEAMMNLGIANYNLKDYDKAIYWLSEYSKYMPKEKKQMVDYLKASALYKNDNTEMAIKYFEELASLEPATEYSKKAVLFLIEIYSNRKDEEKVSYYLNKIQGTKEYNTAMIMIGDLYVTKENYDKALSYYAQSDDPKNPRLIYGQAYSLYKKERYKEALQKFNALKNTDYYNQSIYHIFAINYKLGNFNEIIDNREIIRKVVVKQTDTDNIIRIIANSAYQVGNYKLAKDYYGRLFAVSPDKENLFRVILLDSEMLDMEDLANRFAQYNKLYPDDTEYKKDVYLYTGDAYYKTGNTERAEEIYKAYLDEYKNIEVISSLVSTLLDQKKYDEMEQYLSSVNDEESINYLKGIAAIGLAKYDEAENNFQKVLANGEGALSTKVYLNRVRNFFLASKYQEAINAGEQYISKINPEKEKAIYSEMLDKIGLSYFRLGKYDEARRYYSKMANIKGYEVYGKYQIADSYYNEKKYENAASQYKAIYENYGETFYGEQAYYKYISTLRLLGNTEAFEREKNNFMSRYPNSSLKSTLTNLSTNFYIENGDTEKAIENIKSVNSDTTDTAVKENNNIKIITLKLKKKDYKDIEKYISELPSSEDKSYYFSQYYSAKNNISKAVKEYENLLKSDKYKTYASDAILKIAENYDKKDNVTEAKKLFLKLYSVKGNKELHVYTLEKLIYYRLLEENMKEAKKYLNELKKLDSKRAQKFNDYF